MMYYRIRECSVGYEVVKFDADFEPTELYTIRDGKCDCPSYRQPCKHVENFLPRFKAAQQINGTLYFWADKGAFVEGHF